MISISPEGLNRIAADRGWLHESGRLRGTINVRKAARQTGLSAGTISRIYDGYQVSAESIEALLTATQATFEELFLIH